MMPPAQASGDGRRDQNPAGTALPTVNWSLVAAATPRVVWPASIDAEPWATTSLKYWPGVASAGTTITITLPTACTLPEGQGAFGGVGIYFQGEGSGSGGYQYYPDTYATPVPTPAPGWNNQDGPNHVN